MNDQQHSMPLLCGRQFIRTLAACDVSAFAEGEMKVQGKTGCVNPKVRFNRPDSPFNQAGSRFKQHDSHLKRAGSRLNQDDSLVNRVDSRLNQPD